MADLLKITTANFATEVEQSDVPVLIDFWAEWCMPCKMVAPIVDAIAEDYGGKLKVGSIDVDAEPDLATRFSVMSIPTLMVFNGGEAVAQRVGSVPRPSIESLFKDLI